MIYTEAVKLLVGDPSRTAVLKVNKLQEASMYVSYEVLLKVESPGLIKHYLEGRELSLETFMLFGNTWELEEVWETASMGDGQYGRSPRGVQPRGSHPRTV